MFKSYCVLPLFLPCIFTFNAHAYLVNGRMFLEDHEKRKPAVIGYVEGVSDMGNRDLFCIPTGTGTSQLKQIALNYMNSNSDMLEYPAATLITRAFNKEFPCTE